jgi:hypothetical protein
MSATRPVRAAARRPRRRWYAAGLLAAAVVLVLAIPATRTRTLGAVGRTLVASDPISRADVIVVTMDAGGAGVLEAADLVRAGMAPKVAVFSDPPNAEDREFLRRGVPYEDGGARAVRQLKALGVTAVEQIPRSVSGTEAEGDVMPGWCAERSFRSVIVVTMPDHSRRVRRVLHRSLAGTGIKVTVHPTPFSGFDANHWWETRGNTRIVIVEIQKLLLDVVRHPFNR